MPRYLVFEKKTQRVFTRQEKKNDNRFKVLIAYNRLHSARLEIFFWSWTADIRAFLQSLEALKNQKQFDYTSKGDQ